MTVANPAEPLQAIFSPAGIQDPYPLYRRARGFGEVQLSPPNASGAFVFGHPEASTLLRSPSVSADRMDQRGGPPGFEQSETYRFLKPMMLFHDGASHARLRGLASQAFTPRAVAEMREFVADIAQRVIDHAATRSDADFVRDVAMPLPIEVIVEMLGLQGGDRERFKAWSESLAALLDGSTLSPELLERAEQDARAVRAYFRDVADELRVNPRPGLMSALASAEAQGDRLSNDELLSNAILLLAAGHETTTSLISGGILALARHPQQWALLVEHPDVTDNAVEELLRFVSPVQGTSRLVTSDVTVGEYTVPAGSFVLLFVGAANRDPRVFERPDELDLKRRNARAHLSFAVGAHYCLGASLARLEAQVVFRQLADRFPDLRVPEQPLQYRPNFVLRGLQALQVQFT